MRLSWLALQAAAAQPEEFERVEQQLEALGLFPVQLHLMHGAMGQHQGAAAVDAGEMVLIALHRREQGLAAGQMAAADQPPLLQVPQMAIHRGQPHGLGAPAQQGMQVLAGEFAIRQPQLLKQQLLTIARGGNLGRHGRAHGAVP